MLKLAIVVLAVMFLALQTKAWFSDVGHFAAADLKQEVLAQAARARRVAAANEQLVAQVLALRSGTEAIEASARTDLGMIRQGEEYYVVAVQDLEPIAGQSSTPPAAPLTPALAPPLGDGAQSP